MNTIFYRDFIFEATKITFFCLFISGIFKLVGASDETLLVVFNMSVMSAAATFSPEKKKLHHILLGSVIIVISIVLAGLIGFYTPLLSKILIIIYAGLAFLLPKSKAKVNIFMTGAVMFLIFSSLPFNLNIALKYFAYGIIVIILFTLLFWIANLKNHISKEDKSEGNKINALIAVSALSLAWLASYLLQIYSSISHLYWIGLTVIVVIQGAQHKNIKTAFIRIIVNFFGAIIIVLLYNYLMPINFWFNFASLVLFLFFIFALAFSYIWRTLFIEMFVLGFTHLFGSYQDIIALDRIILTTIGGLLVIFSTIFFYSIFNLFNKKSFLR